MLEQESSTEELTDTMTDLEEATDRVRQLCEALHSRDRIGQAKGILMERYRITDKDAFEMLSAASQRTNTKVVTVAEQLASTGEFAGIAPVPHVEPDARAEGAGPGWPITWW